MKNVLFWSGGKDSLLARHYLDLPADDIILLTTYNEEESIVPHQQIPLTDIQQQAVSLGHLLTLVPLPHPSPNRIYLERVLAAISALPYEVETLAFGDWKNEEIRAWREKVFHERGLSTRFPIWEKPLDELLNTLESLPCRIVVQSVHNEWQDDISSGVEYGHTFISRLPDEVDPMGENGEFHTRVIFEDY